MSTHSGKELEGTYVQVGVGHLLMLKGGKFQWGSDHFSGTYSIVGRDKVSCIVRFRFKVLKKPVDYRITRRGQTYTFTAVSTGEAVKMRRKDGQSFLAESPRETKRKPTTEPPTGWRQLDRKTAAISYDLHGESGIWAATIPEHPSSKTPAIVRITHSNVYGPVDSDIFLRTNPALRWRKAMLVEDLIWNDKQQRWMLRSEAMGATSVWSATYEATIWLAKGHHPIEIRLHSRGEGVPSVVLSGWKVYVR